MGLEMLWGAGLPNAARVSAPVGLSAPFCRGASLRGQLGSPCFRFSFHLLLVLTLFTALTLMVPPSVYVLQTLPLKHLVIT